MNTFLRNTARSLAAAGFALVAAAGPAPLPGSAAAAAPPGRIAAPPATIAVPVNPVAVTARPAKPGVRPFVQSFARRPEARPQRPLPKPKKPPALAAGIDGCDHGYHVPARPGLCVPWKFPPKVTDRCAWLRTHGYFARAADRRPVHLLVRGTDRHRLDRDRDGVAC